MTRNVHKSHLPSDSTYITLRDAKPADIVTVFNECLKVSVPGFSNWNASKFQESAKNNHLLGISNQGILAGFILWADRGEAVEVLLLATSPNAQRKGIMATALRLWTDQLQEAQRKEVWLEVHELNLPARNLYRKIGFTEVGIRPRYYADGGGAVNLTLRLKSLP